MKLIPRWCPGGGFKIKAAVAAKCVRDLYDVPYNMVREKMVRVASDDDSYCHKLLLLDFRKQVPRDHHLPPTLSRSWIVMAISQTSMKSVSKVQQQQSMLVRALHLLEKYRLIFVP